MQGGATNVDQTEVASSPCHGRVVTRDMIPQLWSRAGRPHLTDRWRDFATAPTTLKHPFWLDYLGRLMRLSPLCPPRFLCCNHPLAGGG